MIAMIINRRWKINQQEVEKEEEDVKIIKNI
jgi:hypothetical protein